MELLAVDIIEETTRNFANDPEVGRRLLWWLRHGQSCERWFQFEWAYRLESVLENRFPRTCWVGFERNRVDIVVYRKPFKPHRALYQQDISAGIEIKWCGNWAAADSIKETKKDLVKIRTHDKYSYPALALSVWLLATPSQSNDPFYFWISQQIESEKVSWEVLDKELRALKPDIRIEPVPISIPIDGKPCFSEFKIFCVGFFNDRAKCA